MSINEFMILHSIIGFILFFTIVKIILGFKRNISKYRIAAFIVVASLLTNSIYWYSKEWTFANVLILVVLLIPVTRITLNINLLYSIIAVTVLYSAVILGETIADILHYQIITFGLLFPYHDEVMSYVSKLIDCGVMYVIYKIIKRRGYVEALGFYSVVFTRSSIMIVIFIFIMTTINSSYLFFDTTVNPIIHKAEHTLPIILVFISIIMILDRYVVTSKEQENKALRSYIDSINELVNEVVWARQDRQNILNSIFNYIRNEQWKSLEEYIQELLDVDVYKVFSNDHILALKRVKNYMAFAILTREIHEARTNGVKIELNVYGEIRETIIRPPDIYDLLEQSMTLSIELAKETKDKKIALKIIEEDRYIIMIIENEYGKKLSKSEIAAKFEIVDKYCERLRQKYDSRVERKNEFKNGKIRQIIKIAESKDVTVHR